MKRSPTAGFTLVEMIIAVGLFSIVTTVCVAALLSLVDANRKAEALQSVMNNLNVAVDSMVRSVREGSDYRCDNASASGAGANCPNGGTKLYYQPYGCGPTSGCADWVYEVATDANGSGRLYHYEVGKCSIGAGTCVPITAPEVDIKSLTFYVVGAARGAAENPPTQPKVVFVIKGTAGGNKVKVQSTFHIQATAVQRILDI